ncbi:MAG: nucleotide-binding protein [Pyrinomonadaceae bacterium]|nr:nucleotide-binding protein [Pyrinomonadaceae bacterium]
MWCYPRVITHDEVVKYWQEHHSNALNGNDTKSVEGNVVCFFHLCQAAELGTMTIGKRGQPARLRVLHDELCKLIEAVVQSAAPTDASTFNFKVNYSHTTADNGCMTHSLLPGKSPQLRVLISCGKDKRVVKQIQATLELEEAESEVVHREEAGACPVSENVIHAMRRCHAAIIVVNGYDCDENHSTDEVGEKIILQVGAALAFYDWRVMLLFDTGLSVPPCLENLPYGRYEGGDLTWDTGVNLMKVVKDFKSN